MKRAFSVLVILMCIVNVTFAQDARRGKVIKKDKTNRVVIVDIGLKDGIKTGSAFVLYGANNRELGCVLAESVSEDRFASDLIPIGIFNEVELGAVAEELGAGCRISGSMLSYIPKGFFGMGDNKNDDEMPPHSVYLNPFYIDKYEVTNKEYKSFVDATGHEAPYLDAEEAAAYNWKDGTYPEKKDNHPVVLVTAQDAKQYCEFVGKRLPTEEEWEKAARGTGNRIWPWGNVWEEGKKTNAVESGIGGTVIIGTFPDDLSPYDVIDIGGNVSEWTSSPYLPYENNHKKNKNYSKKNNVVRGGSFKTGKNESRTSARQFAPPNTKSISIGFRCIKDIY